MKKWAIGLTVCLLAAVVAVVATVCLRPGLKKGTGPVAVSAKAVDHCVGWVTGLFTAKKVNAASRSPADGDNGTDAESGMTADSSAPAPPEVSAIRVQGVISGTHGSAVLILGGRERSVFVGDTFSVDTPEGSVTVRCDKIEDSAVCLTVVKTRARVELRLGGYVAGRK